MDGKDVIIENLKKLGLSEYESKAYMALLKEYPVNGYTLSKNSGIPRSRIYEVLESLRSKQIIFEEESDRASLFYPLEPEMLTNRFKTDFNETINRVGRYIQELYYGDKQQKPVTVIKGRQEIFEFISLLIANARSRIVLSIWREDLDCIKEQVEQALKKGVTLTGMFFGADCAFPQLVIHRRVNRVLSEKKERSIVAIIDQSQVISGIVSRGDESQVMWTKDHGFVQMSEDYIVHDISLNKLLQQLDKDTRKKYEDFLDRVRQQFFGFDEEEYEGFDN
ncbi:MAG: hypothetical protein HPY66_0631 [Firmicutes bacterium]|nr:hypothetical protein [Bacillota bacterium]MDI6706817.1 helix-turn-helix domain-containing protein [Bacillota bacterium]